MLLAFPVVLLAVVSTLASPAAAATWEPWLWNAHLNYTATSVPEDVFTRGQGTSNGGNVMPEYQTPLFPLAGYSVVQQCKGPGQVFNPPGDHDRAGACGYAKVGTKYSYWEKQAGEWMRNSNCYCYAADRFMGSWCSPGVGGGASIMTPDQMSCDALSRAVVADGARPATRAEVLRGTAPAEGGHYIALLFRPQSSCNFPRCMPDYHFMRRDASGLWSHKPGEAPVSNRDANGALISNPEAAPVDGAYTQFCGYFAVVPGKLKLGVQQVPDRIKQGVQQWQAAGLNVKVLPLEYNPATDAISPEALMRERLQAQRQVQGAQLGRKLLGGSTPMH